MDVLVYYYQLLRKLDSPTAEFTPPSISFGLNNVSEASRSVSAFGVDYRKCLNPLRQDYFDGVESDTDPRNNDDFEASDDNISEFLEKQNSYADYLPVGLKNSDYIKEQFDIYNNSLVYELENNSPLKFTGSISRFKWTRTKRTVTRDDSGVVDSDVTEVDDFETSTYSGIESEHTVVVEDGNNGIYFSTEITTSIELKLTLIEEYANDLFLLDFFRIFTSYWVSAQPAPNITYDFDNYDISMIDIDESTSVFIPIPPIHPDSSVVGAYTTNYKVSRLMAKLKNITWLELKQQYPKPSSWN